MQYEDKIKEFQFGPGLIKQAVQSSPFILGMAWKNNILQKSRNMEPQSFDFTRM